MSRLVPAFSRMLMHSLWQGFLLALLVYTVVAVTKKWKAAARYNLIIGLFSGWLAVCVVTFFWEWNTIGGEHVNADFSTAQGKIFPGMFFGSLQPVKQILHSCNVWITTHAAWIALAWLIVFSARMVKTMTALAYHRQIKNKLVSMPSTHWKNTLSRLCSALQIDRVVVLLESGYMKVPVVIGHFKPVILMPAALLLSLSPEQAEAILLHELAHIKRNDYLVNLLQHLAEAIFFFNPAVWWLSAIIREERENCCDDMALAQTKNTLELASALISFKQHQLYSHTYQVAFPGRNQQLLKRVNRILGGNDGPVSIREKIFFVCSCVLLCATAAGLVLAQGRAGATSVSNHTGKPSTQFLKNAVSLVAADQVIQKPGTYKPISLLPKKTVIQKKTVVVKPAVTIMAPPEPLPLTIRQMALLDMEQAKKDQQQARLDLEQARKDQARAGLDQEKAMIDQRQSMLDQAQANRDMQLAKIDQQKAMKDQADAKRQEDQFYIDAQKTLANKKEAARMRIQPVQ